MGLSLMSKSLSLSFGILLILIVLLYSSGWLQISPVTNLLIILSKEKGVFLTIYKACCFEQFCDSRTYKVSRQGKSPFLFFAVYMINQRDQGYRSHLLVPHQSRVSLFMTTCKSFVPLVRLIEEAGSSKYSFISFSNQLVTICLSDRVIMLKIIFLGMVCVLCVVSKFPDLFAW